MVFGATLYFGVQSYLRSTLQDGLIDQAKAIGTTFLAFEEQKGPAWMGGEISEAYAPEVSGRFIRITRQDGKVIYQSGDTRDPLINTDTIPPPTFERDSGWFRKERQPGANNLSGLRVPLPLVLRHAILHRDRNLSGLAGANALQPAGHRSDHYARSSFWLPPSVARQ